MSETIESLRESVVEQVDELDLDEAYIEDRITEIADSTVPVYNYTILEVVSSDAVLFNTEPECGPAFDGEATMVNIAAAVIYEDLSQTGYERLRERQEEAKEAEELVEELADEFDENGMTDLGEHLREHGIESAREWIKGEIAEAVEHDDPEGWRLGNLRTAQDRLEEEE